MHEFTKKAESVLEKTRQFAIKHKYTYIGTEHILYGLVKEQASVAGKILLKQKITAKYIEQEILKIDGVKENEESIEIIEPTFTLRAKKVIENSIKEANKTGANYVGTEHILLALMKETDSIAVRILIEASVDPEKVFTDIIKYITEEHYTTSSAKNTNTQSLNTYTEDITELARKNKLEQVVGMEPYIARCLQILLRRNKNNVLVIGEAGVGKTSLVYALTKRLLKENEGIRKRVLELDISSMLAGAKYRGDFEERLKKCILEAKMEEDILLYIDDMRNIVSLGNTEGSLDAANILKPYLSRSEIQVVGTCTTEEYAKYIEKDMSLNRLFQIVEVKEPTKEETYNIINGIKHKYEKHHNVIVNENVIKESIELGNRYIHTRKMPDKIIDILDEACAKAKTEKREDVIIEDVENVISKISNIPIQKIKKSEKEKLILLEKRLKENVIGQDEAIKKIANAIKRNRLGIRDTKRPMGVFLFTGPTRRWQNRVSKSSCK